MLLSKFFYVDHGISNFSGYKILRAQLDKAISSDKKRWGCGFNDPNSLHTMNPETSRGEVQMGPLNGLRVIELQGIGPGPFCGMMLADMGAEIIRVDRAGSVGTEARESDVLARGRKSIGVDLKNPDGVETVLKLIETADVLLEGFLSLIHI